MRKITITSEDIIRGEDQDLIQTLEVENYAGDDFTAHLFHDLTSSLSAVIIEHILPGKADNVIDLIARQLRDSVERAKQGHITTHAGSVGTPAEKLILDNALGFRGMSRKVKS